VGGQRHGPAALPLGKTWYLLCRSLGGYQNQSGQVWKISPPPGLDPRTVQPVASLYTDWAIPALFDSIRYEIQCVPLATEPGISLIILTPMKILQRNLKRITCGVWEMKMNVSLVRFKIRCNILISGKIIKEMSGSVASGTRCMKFAVTCWIVSNPRMQV